MAKMIFAAFLAVGTTGVYVSTTHGWGLESPTQKPISIRRKRPPRAIGVGGVGGGYYGGSGYRSHMGGGYRGGK